MRVTVERFRELVSEALDQLPAEFARHLDNVEVIVEDLPERALGRRFPGLLLGLYHGVPKTERSVFMSPMPDIIYIFKKNVEAVSRSEQEIRDQVRATVLHEIGHHFGMSEDQLRGI